MASLWGLRWVWNRILYLAPVAVLATFFVFGLLYLVPGDPAVTLAGENATPQHIEDIRRLYGLNRPIVVQYADWLDHVAHGDLSVSLLSGEPVAGEIAHRLPNTLLIVAGALALSILIGVPLSIAAALKPGSRLDHWSMAIASTGVSIPSFWLAMALVSTFALGLHWFPATGATSLSDGVGEAIRHVVLPAVALSASGIATIARQLRGAFADALAAPYVRTLRAKGLSPSAILWKHCLKNVSVPFLTVLGLLANRLLGATVVIEVVFAIPGIGSMVINAAINKDFPVVQGVVLVTVAIVIAINLVVDGLCRVLDPRIARI
jgi:peptide/nickel transport system permease protein